VKITLIILGSIVVFGVIMFFVASMGISDIKKMVINEVDLSKIADGVYKGTFHKVRWTYEVEVTVKDHRITSIKNINKLPDPAVKLTDGAIKSIIDKQSVKIDVVSGATINTKAFQKAVENALVAGIN
jgi:uncharacterized protein with FMN-binding domain